MKALLRIVKPASSQWVWLLTGLLLGVLVICANGLLMALSGWFITSMAIAGVAKLPFNYFFASAGIRALAITRTVGRYGERLVTHDATFRMLSDLRVWFFKRLIPLAPAGLERYASGDLAGRLRNDLDGLENFYLRIIAPIATGLITILLACLFVAFWDGAAALLLLALLLLAGLLLPCIGLRLNRKAGGEGVHLAGELRSQITQGLQGAEELLLLGGVKQQADRVERLSLGLINRQLWQGNVAAATNSLLLLIAGLAMPLLALLLIPQVTAGALSGPNLVMLLLFAAACFEAVAPLSLSLQQLPAVQGVVWRINELSGAAAPVADPVTTATVQPQRFDISIKNLTISYGNGVPVFQRFNLLVASGERVALVGPSGSGKSTLMELLLRFRRYDGAVKLAGVELTELSADQLSGLVAAVPQSPHLFNGSIADNILLGRECSRERLQQILHVSCLDEWITALPDGLDTPVGEGGGNVSGGEARRIALARALVADRPVILLDEPTEGVDAVTEQRLVERLHGWLAGKTLLLATHRPACLRLVERVVRTDL